MNLNWKIPRYEDAGKTIDISLIDGSVVFVVGANGTGKSALMTHLAKSHGNTPLVRIAAHRQSWFSSASVDLTQRTRKKIDVSIRQQDQSDESRWKDDSAAQRAQAALFDLANAENRESRQIVELLKKEQSEEATRRAKLPSPIEAINEILKICTLTVRLSINNEGDVFAQHAEGPAFSMTQLSDGERNAVMLAAQVLTAVPGSLFLVDEPERHLHRSITEPLLGALFEKRKDCAFVVSTHEPELPNSSPSAPVVLVRRCRWEGNLAKGWDIDLLPADTPLPDDTRKAILGSRRVILFVEGEVQSLDYPLYSALFPEMSVIPTSGCRDVENAVTGLSETTGLHWLHAVGMIDRDDRTDEQVKALSDRAIFALNVSAVESVFYSSVSIDALSALQAQLIGADSGELSEKAKAAALQELTDDVKSTLAARRSEKSIRNAIMSHLPAWKELLENKDAKIKLEVATPFADELNRIGQMHKAADYDGIISRYQIKKSGIPSVVAHSLKFQDRKHFEETVVALAKRDEQFRHTLRSLLGAVATHIDSVSCE